GAAGAVLGELVGVTVDWIDARFDKLADVLAALAVMGELPRDVLDGVLGLGEVFSAKLLGTHLRALGEDCAVLVAREVL
ncbi:hypothetical protein AAGG49_22270, partial [Stenotrophomonas maltophilia]|uniref:hypothetical protein n=1 Tax=Stenotrophomonas maltophilia TaxID=40324 RepID=UPI00313B1444